MGYVCRSTQHSLVRDVGSRGTTSEGVLKVRTARIVLISSPDDRGRAAFIGIIFTKRDDQEKQRW